MDRKTWPVLKTYDAQHLARIALPIGGIGTGTVSLGGRGDLRDWEIVNRPAKGFRPKNSFFALWVERPNGERVTKVLEGPLEESEYEGPYGSMTLNCGLPRFRNCRFETAYPLGQVILQDPAIPLKVRIQAYNPLIPGDAQRSGIPCAVIRFVLENPGAETLQVAVCSSLQNFIGQDGSHSHPCQNVNRWCQEKGLEGIIFQSLDLDPRCEQWGSIALCLVDAKQVTHRTGWAKLSWNDTLSNFWEDFSEDGRLEEPEPAGDANPIASLASRFTVRPGETAELTYLLTWHFPNRMSWDDYCKGGTCELKEPLPVGNYYATQYQDAWDVAVQTAGNLVDLETETGRFVDAFCGSDLPEVMKEAALFNVSTLRSQTCFRTADGRMFGWEGCADHRGSCHGSSNHVWNYEQATAFLFGDLARTMREVEFAHATSPIGLISMRVNLPIERASEWGVTAADGQMGCLMKLYRDWQLSGDDDLLRSLWPNARKAMEFCWIEGGWDADGDGVMEGCQHNTMDVEYFGPNPQMGTWYLGALWAVAEMAQYLGDHDFAATCRKKFARGREWIESHLFNGEYYEQEIRPPADPTKIAAGLGLKWRGSVLNLADPEMQIGAGCLIDQLVGQYMAHICGLGYLLDPEHIRTTLQSILKYNLRENFYDHFNHMRAFVLNDETGLLMCSYPRGRRPVRPFPYYTEVMTGFEYTAAVGMLYEGMLQEGLRCITAIRSRYDGRRRNPFNEAECGHHYARAMASWASLLALTGFHYSGVNKTLQFTSPSKPGKFFWSNGSAWGTCAFEPGDGHVQVRLSVLHGELEVRRFELVDVGVFIFTPGLHLKANETQAFQVSENISSIETMVIHD